MKLNAILLSSLLLVFVSCKKTDSTVTPVTPQPLSASSMLNVAYGADPAQKMDVYLPAARTATTTRTIIMIHGGAWTSGDKSDFAAYIDTLQKRLPDCAIININYRLATITGNNIFPTEETDVKAAVDFISSKKAEFVIADKFVLMGASAGAHLALLQAYKNTSPSIKAVVDFFGPTDMADMYNNPASSSAPPAGIAILLGGFPPSALYTSSSPINFVNSQSPPTIIFHGGMDPLVRVLQSTTLRDKLILNGRIGQYWYYPTEGHGWIGTDLSDSFAKIQAFISLYVQ